MKKFFVIGFTMLLIMSIIPTDVYAKDDPKITVDRKIKCSADGHDDFYYIGTTGVPTSIYLDSDHVTPKGSGWTAADSGHRSSNIFGLIYDGGVAKYYRFNKLSDQRQSQLAHKGWYVRADKDEPAMKFDDSAYTWTGHKFQGFYCKNVSKDQVSDTKPSGAGKKVVNADMSFCFTRSQGVHESDAHAWFKPCKYKVIIDTGLGEFSNSNRDYYASQGFGSSNKYSNTIGYDKKFNLKNPTLSKWDFRDYEVSVETEKTGEGYSLISTHMNGKSNLWRVLQQGTINFTARWKSKLSYNTNDVSWSQNPSLGAGDASSTALYATGSSIKTIKTSTASMTGYIFNGWAKKKDVGSQVVAGGHSTYQPIKSDGEKTFYAMWTPITYSVNYDVGLTNHGENLPGSQQHTFDITYDNATDKGYNEDNYKIASGANLVGRDYTIYFNTNIPSTCSTAATMSTNGASLNPITGRLESVGGTNRWRCNENGVFYSDNQTAGVYNLTSINNGSVTMVARWNSKNVTGFPTGLTMDGYEFKGWATTPTSKQQVSYVTVDPAKTAYTGTLYAIWEPLPYWVKYYPKDGGSGSVITEEWKFDSPHPLFNNTPNLSGTPATSNSGSTPHFTKLGNYVSSWNVGSITGTRNATKDRAGSIITGTAYTPQDSSYSITRNEVNLCTPRAKDCVVNLYTDWTNLKYKIQYNNDTSVPFGPDRGYKFSTATYTTSAYTFDQNVEPWINNFTRENKYGRSTFLGYCHVNGDTYLTPKVVVPGQSPQEYLLKANPTGQLDVKAPTNVITQAIWSRSGNNAPDKSFDYITNETFNRNEHTKWSTTTNVTYNNYFAYMNQGAIQAFPLYAVWDDCPGCEPEDLEQELGAAVKQFTLCTPGIGSRTASKKDLEWYILKANAGTVWDREQTNLTTYLDSDDPCLDPGYYIDSFANTNISAADPISSYELRYTVKDRSGNRYQTSRKLYGGNFVDIMLHENVQKLKR